MGTIQTRKGENKMTEKLDITKRIVDIREMYSQAETGGYSALIMGEFGTGKTSLFRTCPKPVLIDMFDPRGHLVLRDEIEKGEIYIRPFYNESYKKPTEYIRWEKQWEEDIKTGFLDNFATYGIDSATTFIQSMANQISKMEGRPKGSLAIQDYNIIYNTIRDIIKITSFEANCVFLLTAHLVTDKDEVTQEIKAELDIYKRLKSQLPLLFTEKYVLGTKSTSRGVEYELLTAPTGRYRASTQLGKDGLFNVREKPDIKYLIEKAGMSYPDKPLFK